ncbi:MAG: type II toxin-antitoxin system RelE/ParE family toxin [Candidatus Omnitrophica bacterium]|nr:type II toxin-antitoxin system RelE/ParE family toxin [Candidatus Omnitrophota bacterium]
MKYYINKSFQRDLKENKLNADYIRILLEDIYDGRAISLGSKMYKIRAAKKGKGKSSSFRNIFFWKKDKRIIFCLLYGKNEQANVTDDDKKALKILSREYDFLTEDEIKKAIKLKIFKEVQYDKPI